jgi:hypothetical protein
VTVELDRRRARCPFRESLALVRLLQSPLERAVHLLEPAPGRA